MTTKDFKISPLLLSLILFIFSLSGCFGIDLINLNLSKNSITTAIETGSTDIPIPEPKAPVSITIASVGDILMHTPLITSKEYTNYDFNPMFQHVDELISSYDYSVANLEITTAGDDFKYTGYPTFNCPDTILPALSQTGFDMLLGSNNHRLDTGKYGFYRTIDEIEENNLEVIGIKKSQEEKSYKIVDIKGIKVGFTNYTYENGIVNGKPSINGIEVPDELVGLLDSYNQYDLENEKASIQARLSEMRKDGAEFIIFYPHWGEEYKEEPTSAQRDMAQFLCDEGVDVIIGGHPHVLEPTDMLTSQDGSHNTLVLYSLGNFISDQRLETLNNQSTEWGVIFTITLEKDFQKNDVTLKSSDYIPTWARKAYIDGNLTYEVVPTTMVDDIDNLSENEKSRIRQADSSISAVLNQYNTYSKKN